MEEQIEEFLEWLTEKYSIAQSDGLGGLVPTSYEISDILKQYKLEFEDSQHYRPIHRPWYDTYEYSGNSETQSFSARTKNFGLQISKPWLLMHGNCAFLGNSPQFWGERGGYTQWIDEAKRFTEKDADAHIRSTLTSHNFKKVLFADMEKISKLTVDVQDMQ